MASETFEWLQPVWVKVQGKWYEALYWKTVDGNPVFTTDGITEITGCDWKQRVPGIKVTQMSKSNWVKDTIIERDKGITKHAIRKKRERGYWVEGVHFKKGPDGVYYYDINAINEWIEQA